MKHLIQGSDEWLAYRKTSIGASDVAAILGISPWKTPYSLWREKMSLDETIVTYSMKRGTALEDEARSEFETLVGEKMHPKVVIHPEHSFLMASLDGMSEDGEMIVEIKVPNSVTHLKAVNGIVEPYYNCQMQMQMACTNLDMCHYYSYDGKNGAVVVVHRDQKFIDHMVEKCSEFYFNHMLANNPPEMLDKDYLDFSEDEEWLRLEKEFVDICDQMEYMSTAKEVIKKNLLDLSRGHNIKGDYLKMTRVLAKGRVDYDKIEELRNIDLEKYRKPMSESVRITMAK